MIGLVVSCSSDRFDVEIDEKIIKVLAKGKFKKDDILPIVGDLVEVEDGVICRVLNRKSFCKRPKIANLSQIIFVVSMKLPKPDLILLDKQLAYAEFLGIKPIICFNKIDLDNSLNIKNLYEKIGYSSIETNAKICQGIDKLKNILKDNITAFAGNSGVRQILSY